MRSFFKLAMAATFVLMASLGTNAQLVITPNGHAHFGDTTVVDSTAIVHVAGYGTNGSKGKVVLAPGFKVERGALFSVTSSDY